MRTPGGHQGSWEVSCSPCKSTLGLSLPSTAWEGAEPGTGPPLEQSEPASRPPEALIPSPRSRSTLRSFCDPEALAVPRLPKLTPATGLTQPLAGFALERPCSDTTPVGFPGSRGPLPEPHQHPKVMGSVEGGVSHHSSPSSQPPPCSWPPAGHTLGPGLALPAFQREFGPTEQPEPNRRGKRGSQCPWDASR